MEFVSNFRRMLKNRFKEDMEVLSTYKDKLASIQKLVGRLENGSLEIAELSELERLTREIHERSIILRYKAMEQKIKPEVKSAELPITEVPSEPTPAPIENEPVLFEEEKAEVAEEVSLDFALFDTQPEEEEVAAPEETPFVNESIENQPIDQVEETPIELSEETESEEKPVSVSGFVSTVNIPSDAMAHFSVVKITTLIGALGLNERLRFINELFDGSSEEFSDAIKKLETFESLSDASKTIDELASTHSWDPKEEAVQEFIIVLKRRYA